MNSDVKIAMKKIALADLLSLEAYEAQRPVIRQAIMDHKKTRRVPQKRVSQAGWDCGP